MPTLLDPVAEAIAPTEADTANAQKSSRELARLLKNQNADTLHLHVVGDDATDITVSGAALRLLVQVLDEIGKGHAVTVLSAQQELSPQQAAALLGMSRTLLNSLLDRQEIPFRYVGADKRIRLSDVLALRADMEYRRQLMLELTAQAQELGLYDDFHA